MRHEVGARCPDTSVGGQDNDVDAPQCAFDRTGRPREGAVCASIHRERLRHGTVRERLREANRFVVGQGPGRRADPAARCRAAAAVSHRSRGEVIEGKLSALVDVQGRGESRMTVHALAEMGGMAMAAAKPPEHLGATEYLYCITYEGRLKIGRVATAASLRRRLRDIQTGNPDAELVKKWIIRRNWESHVRRFATYNLPGLRVMRLQTGVRSEVFRVLCDEDEVVREVVKRIDRWLALYRDHYPLSVPGRKAPVVELRRSSKSE